MKRRVFGPTEREFLALRVLPKILSYARDEWDAAYTDHPLDLPWSDRDKLAEAVRRINAGDASSTKHVEGRLTERDGFLRTATAPARSEYVANREEALRVVHPEQGVKDSGLGTVWVRGVRADAPPVKMTKAQREADPWLRYFEYREWMARARMRDPKAPGPVESYYCRRCNREVWRAHVGGEAPIYCGGTCRQAAHRLGQDAEPSEGF